jgi:hypothetical protein
VIVGYIIKESQIASEKAVERMWIHCTSGFLHFAVTLLRILSTKPFSILLQKELFLSLLRHPVVP